ncbi:hypothetical protein KC19_7G069600 [Ceratodon purpureus]|uniref:Uncharacterized protein n=1 Tax=Ceratodon purpureus TaxID=3225 RepID=A0A8T0H5J7_CERPU|nr:hypothetical protein KC19_7G069600 [Ceratodon purpureus]
MREGKEECALCRQSSAVGCMGQTSVAFGVPSCAPGKCTTYLCFELLHMNWTLTIFNYVGVNREPRRVAWCRWGCTNYRGHR